MNDARLVSVPETVSLVAPVDGVVFPLDSVPDPVFAEKVLGDGVAIDPTSGLIVAPCAGVVAQLHRAKHALTLRTANGVSVLLHVGVDTVSLGGKGFSVRVAEGDSVEVGQVLLEVDLDSVGRSAKSLITLVIVTEGAELFSFKREQGLVTSGTDEIARVFSTPAPPSGTHDKPNRSGQSRESSSIDDASRAVVRIVNPHGMHARPAARLTREAKGFDAEIYLAAAGATVSALSVSDILSLDLAHGDEVEVWATGPHAATAVAALQQAIAEGLGENLDPAAHFLEAARLVTDQEGILGGVPASPGVAVGVAKVKAFDLPRFARGGKGVEVELAALERGLGEAFAALVAEELAFSLRGEAEKAQIFAAHHELLEDESLVAEAKHSVGSGASAACAFHDVLRSRIERLGSLKSPLLRQRATDMNDVLCRVLHAILELPQPSIELGPDSVLLCEDLNPSTIAALPADRIAAVVTALGGATSHAAIIARSMGVPYVAALGDAFSQIKDGQVLIVNGSTGAVTLDPSAEALEVARAEIRRSTEKRADAQSRADESAITSDGRRIEIGANIGNLKDAENAIMSGCDGVGLLRSEFLFLDRRDAPSEVEQRRAYVGIAGTLGKQRSLVVRTLDVGGDKPLPYIPLAEEENPFLGIRGVRVSFKYPELFRSQVRAALAAAELTKLHLMFPMVSGYDEFLCARDMTREEMRAMGVSDVSIGVMVEVPSAALNAHWLAEEVDFFSIGTNDLTQYTLAMDRGHAELAASADAFDPAVLRLIKMTSDAAHAAGKWVGVCGDLAANPLASALLVGLDIDELSVPARAIPELKDRIRSLRSEECRALAEGALAQPSAKAVRELLASFHDN